MKFPHLVFTLLLLPPALHAEDIDLFTRDLDLSTLSEPETPPAAPPEISRALFASWNSLPPALRTLPRPADGEIQLISLPAGPFLAVPNPPHLPRAYTLLTQALAEGQLTPQPPLVVLLHADNNLSVGCRVSLTHSIPLPLGSDLSPMPERRILITPTQADTATRTHPAFLAAAARLRRHAHENGFTLDTRELYLLPVSPETVLFGLRVMPE